MANFIYDEGASALLKGTANWETDSWAAYLYDNQVTPATGDTFTDYTVGLIDSQPMTTRAVSSTGRATADGIQFTNVSPQLTDGRLVGVFIYRTSDNLLMYHIDEGFDGLSPAGASGELTPINNVNAAGMTVTVSFTMQPSLANGNAWFRP